MAIWAEWRNDNHGTLRGPLLEKNANVLAAKNNANAWGTIISCPERNIEAMCKIVSKFIGGSVSIYYFNNQVKIQKEFCFEAPEEVVEEDQLEEDELEEDGANANGAGASAMEVDAVAASNDAPADANGAGADANGAEAAARKVAAKAVAQAEAAEAAAKAMSDAATEAVAKAMAFDGAGANGAGADLLAVNAALDQKDGDFRDAIASGFEALPEPEAGAGLAAGGETDAVPAGGSAGGSAVVEVEVEERPAKRPRVAVAPETVEKVGAASTAPSPLPSHSHSHSHDGGRVLCTSDSDSSSDDDDDELRRLRAARDALDEKIMAMNKSRPSKRAVLRRGGKCRSARSWQRHTLAARSCVKKDRGRRNADRTSWLVKAPPNFSTNDLTDETMRVIPPCSIVFFATDLPKLWVTGERERGEQTKYHLDNGKAVMGVEYMTGQAILRYIKDQELRGSTGGKIYVGSQPQGRGDGRRVPTLAEVSEDLTINYRSSAIRLCVLYGGDETSTFECLADRPKDALAIEDPFLCVQPYPEMHKQLFGCHLAGAKSRVGALEYFLTNSRPREETATFLTHARFLQVSFYQPTPVAEASAVLAGWGLTMFATEDEEYSSSSGEEISDSEEEDESAVDFD